MGARFTVGKNPLPYPDQTTLANADALAHTRTAADKGSSADAHATIDRGCRGNMAVIRDPDIVFYQ